MAKNSMLKGIAFVNQLDSLYMKRNIYQSPETQPITIGITAICSGSSAPTKDPLISVVDIPLASKDAR